VAFNIKNDEADTLLRELTSLTGESLTDAVIASLRERLDRERRLLPLRSVDPLRGADPLAVAIERLRTMTVLDRRDVGDILGLGSDGLPA